MAYVAPTPTQFADRFCPVFEQVKQTAIQAALDRAARMVDESWTEGDFAEARMLHAAWDLTKDGLGATAAAAEAKTGRSLKRREAADHKIEFFQAAAVAGYADAGLYGANQYGRSFWDLLKRNRGGPRTTGGGALGYSPAATDWPYYR